MGVDELTEDPLPVDEDMTIEMLCQIYGREAVRRGLEYIQGLSNADKAYRQSANKQKLKQGLEEGYGVEDVEGERVEEASSNWERSMQENGLGILDDE